ICYSDFSCTGGIYNTHDRKFVVGHRYGVIQFDPKLPGIGQLNKSLGFAVFEKPSLGDRRAKKTRPYGILFFNPQDDPGPVRVEDPEQKTCAYSSYAGEFLDLLYFLLSDRHG